MRLHHYLGQLHLSSSRGKLQLSEGSDLRSAGLTAYLSCQTTLRRGLGRLTPTKEACGLVLAGAAI